MNCCVAIYICFTLFRIPGSRGDEKRAAADPRAGQECQPRHPGHSRHARDTLPPTLYQPFTAAQEKKIYIIIHTFCHLNIQCMFPPLRSLLSSQKGNFSVKFFN